MTYRVTAIQKLMIVFCAILPTLGVIAAITFGKPPAPIFVYLIFSLLALFACYSYLFKVQLEATIENNAHLKFKAFGGESSLTCRDVYTINASKWNHGFVTIKYSSGSMFLLRSMPNIKDLIERIRSFNNLIEVRGKINV
jgi:hypothetical protein